jgi:hypothetical protein
MERQEAAKIVAVLKATFPNFPIPDPDALLTGYLLGLSDCPYDLVVEAVGRWIREGRPFFPAPAELRALVVERVLPFPTPEEAWAEVRRGMSAVGAWGMPTWSCWPLKQAVDAIGWRVLCCSPEGDGDTAERFERTYRTYRDRAIRDANLPALFAGGAVGVALETGK